MGPIDLPPPTGTARRTQPLTTEWVIDPSLVDDPAFVTAFRSEAPVAIRYLASYALPSDRLGFSPPAPGLPVVTQQATLSTQVNDPVSLTTGAPSTTIDLPPPTARRDRAIVVLTADPQAWTMDIPQGPVPAPPTAQPHPPQTRWYIIVVDAGSGPHTDIGLPGRSEPQTLRIDPDVRGDLARALARVFVSATGAGWS
jgi:hypothetical protein